MTGVLVALCLFVFAVVNIVFEITDHFADGRYADYAAAFTVMNWLVVFLKVIGAAVAWLSVTRRQHPLSKPVLAMLLWGAFATLAVYTIGSVAEAIGIIFELTDNGDHIDLAATAYLVFFLLVAVGYGILAGSYSRRHHLSRRPAILGILGAPVVLGLVLVAVPMVLTAVGIMPSP
ncbi:hypothetical protein ABZ946_37345 [Streptomyces sp. NPDC046324]|uniref:hypothetical protein n=1 Tax=unclassified Streptomyces TaxID=2593676 RepID=UPI0033C5DA8E